MATLEECRAALDALAARLGGTGRGSASSSGPDLDRSVSCTVPDLGVTFSGNLVAGALLDVTTAPRPQAQLRFTAASDDLVALTDGRLAFPTAWADGRVKVQAGVLDLLKLRSML